MTTWSATSNFQINLDTLLRASNYAENQKNYPFWIASASIPSPAATDAVPKWNEGKTTSVGENSSYTRPSLKLVLNWNKAKKWAPTTVIFGYNASATVSDVKALQ